MHILNSPDEVLKLSIEPQSFGEVLLRSQWSPSENALFRLFIIIITVEGAVWTTGCTVKTTGWILVIAGYYTVTAGYNTVIAGYNTVTAGYNTVTVGYYTVYYPY